VEEAKPIDLLVTVKLYFCATLYY